MYQSATGGSSFCRCAYDGDPTLISKVLEKYFDLTVIKFARLFNS